MIELLLEQVAVVVGSAAILIPAALAAYGKGKLRTYGTFVFATEAVVIVALVVRLLVQQ